jgi:hypothetical protein
VDTPYEETPRHVPDEQLAPDRLSTPGAASSPDARPTPRGEAYAHD